MVPLPAPAAEKMGDQEKKAFLPDWLKNFPFPPNEKRPVVLRDIDALRGTFGDDHRVGSDVFVSTDTILMGDFRVPPGEHFDPDIHGGIEVYYVESGSGVCLDPETGNGVALSVGDVLIIPERTWHQCFNFGDQVLRVLTLIVGNAWSDSDGMGTAVVYSGEAKYYMPGGREEHAR